MGAVFDAAACRRAPTGVHTLCYHRIPPGNRRDFARQLDFLGRHGSFVGADEALELVRSGAAVKDRYFLLSFDDGYADQLEVALPLLRDRGIRAIAFIVTSWLDEPPRNEAAYMTRANLARWRAAGMDVGSHSHTHRQLSALSDTEVQDELARSSAVLADATGEAPRHFACPWGVPGRDFRTESAPQMAHAAGYTSFFTTTRGAATVAVDTLLMPRHVVEPHWPLYELDALMGGGTQDARTTGP